VWDEYLLYNFPAGKISAGQNYFWEEEVKGVGCDVLDIL
jgi:hypothetical protein